MFWLGAGLVLLQRRTHLAIVAIVGGASIDALLVGYLGCSVQPTLLASLVGVLGIAMAYAMQQTRGAATRRLANIGS